ncbi:MAG: thioredoxin-disulfide reductase [Clostridia bacterium]|nr:thioredoxin-disulfide reductase [Clostridia bacterium]
MRRERQQVHCDVLILGGGPAGLSAAIYAARAKLFTVVIDEGLPGGQVSTTFHVANYPGTNGVIRGLDLMENMKRQAVDFGTQLDEMKEIHEVNFDGEEKHIKTQDTDYYAKCVIIATGAQPRKLPAEGEREFRGRGVHYCATCDGALYQDTNVVVVGGGNSAVEEAVFLTRYAKHVTIIHQFDHFQASKAAQEEALKNPNISVIWDSEIRKINGENFVTSITIENLKTREQKELETDGVFVYIGMQPKTDVFKDKIALDEYGYIVGDEDMKTNVDGIFVAGDVRVKKIRQIATATSDGVIAGIMAERYINGK